MTNHRRESTWTGPLFDQDSTSHTATVEVLMNRTPLSESPSSPRRGRSFGSRRSARVVGSVAFWWWIGAALCLQCSLRPSFPVDPVFLPGIVVDGFSTTRAALARRTPPHRVVVVTSWSGPLSSRATRSQPAFWAMPWVPRRRRRFGLRSSSSSSSETTTESTDTTTTTTTRTPSSSSSTSSRGPRNGSNNPGSGRPRSYNNNNSNNNSNNSDYRGRDGPRNGAQRPRGDGPARGGGGGAASGGGGGGAVLKLTTPLKIQRLAVEIPPSLASQSDSSSISSSSSDRYGGGGRGGADRGGGRGGEDRRGSRSPRPYASTGTSSPAGPGVLPGGRPVGDASDVPIITKDGVTRRRDPKKPDKKRGQGDGDERAGGGGGITERRAKAVKVITTDDSDGRNNRRASLRVGPAKKGGQAEVGQRRGSLKRKDRTAEREAKAEAAMERKTVQLPDGPLSISELAEIIDEKPVAIIKFLMSDFGVMASITQSLDQATCMAVAEGFGKVVGGADELDDELLELMAEESALKKGMVDDGDNPEDLAPRPPVVTIMGHVDHGKTSLLDAIRNTRVTAGEAGGITQHIAAYQVNHEGRLITFIDTPGHAAFTDMRQRGANMTDIVILVVAADDGVKQQTADSIMCARQAGVPLVVAINKCDLDTADPIRVMTDLTGYDVLTEDFGGEVMSSQISAKTGSNIDDLLDKVMLQAEIQNLRANPNRPAECIVVEAQVEKGLGTVATTLVKKGTLKIGDVFVAGETYGRVRALISTTDDKIRLKEAGPSVPVRVVGFEGIPSAGDILAVVQDEQSAREMAESRQRLSREKQSSSYQAGLMSQVSLAFGSAKERRELCVLVKADVQGSAEALTRALRELKRENEVAVVTIKVLVSEAGEVTKSDIAIASVTPGTTVIAFNVAASVAAMDDARSLGIPIEYYNIVYDAIESVESRMQEILSPTPDGEYAGSATVQAVFNIGGLGNIAGSKCTNGFLKKGANVRVMRGDKILKATKVKSLRSFKSEVDSVEEGNECGIGLVDFEDFQPGDIVECYVE